MKTADEPDIIKIINIVEPGVKMTSIINEINLSIIYKREGVVGSLPDVLVGCNTYKEPARGMWGVLNQYGVCFIVKQHKKTDTSVN